MHTGIEKADFSLSCIISEQMAPALVLALAFLGGVCFLQIQPVIGATLWTDNIWLSYLPILLWLVIIARPYRTFYVFLTGFLWALLFAHQYLEYRLDSADLALSSSISQDWQVTGRVVGLPVQGENSVRFDFEIDSIVHQSNSVASPSLKRLRLSWYYPDFRAANSEESALLSGETWQFIVRLKPPHGVLNPGGFDYEKWLYLQSIHATGYVRKSQQNRRLEEAEFSVDGLRQTLRQHIIKINHSEQTGLLLALTLGDKSMITPQQWRNLINTGTSHLMAISGLHIGLVAMMAYVVSRRLVPAIMLNIVSAQQIAASISILIAGFYALLAGFSVPTQRAFVMLLVMMLAIILRRPAFSLNTLSLAAIAVLLWQPAAVLSPGFWLSFIAVLIITGLVMGRRYVFGLSGWQAWLYGIRTQWLIAFAMLPVTMMMFQQASLISPLANSLLIPLTGFVIVPLALLASVLSPVFSELSLWLFNLTAICLGYADILLGYFSSIPVAANWFAAASPFALLSAAMGTLVILIPKPSPLRFSGLILILPICLMKPALPRTGELWLHLIDVGQGLSILIQTREHSLLYDAGAKYSERFDLGDRVVVPYLRYQGIHRLDKMIISHGDRDHAGGALAVLGSIEVKSLMGDARWLSRLQTDQAPINHHIRPLKLESWQGMSWRWDGVDFYVLHPDKPYRKTNNRSCVLLIKTPQQSVLLTGDIEKSVEKSLMHRYPELMSADILVLAHHGSQTSSSQAFLQQVKPKLALVSAGYLNRFHHPATKVQQRLESLGIPLLNTATAGAILVKLSALNGRAVTETRGERKVDLHYWNHRF